MARPGVSRRVQAGSQLPRGSRATLAPRPRCYGCAPSGLLSMLLIIAVAVGVIIRPLLLLIAIVVLLVSLHGAAAAGLA